MSTAEILERVLDKGIVVDGWVILSVAGLDLIAVEGRAVITSLTTYSRRSEAIARALGRAPRKTSSPPARALIETGPAPIAALPLCPRCGRRGRKQPLMVVTVQTDTETRVSSRCSTCQWQRTNAA